MPTHLLDSFRIRIVDYKSEDDISEEGMKISKILTINVPVVYMGRYEVVLRGDYP